MMKALTKHVATKAGLTTGTNLFMGLLPNTDTTPVIALREVGADSVDPYRPKNHTKAVQVLVRHKNYEAAQAEANRISELLLGANGLNLDGWFVFSITGNGPQFTSHDSKGRCEFTTHLLVRAEKEA